MFLIKKQMIKKLNLKKTKQKNIQNYRIKLIITFKYTKIKIKINKKRMIYTKINKMYK